MTSEKQEQAVKWLTEEVRSLRMAPAINGCGPENWVDLLEIMETCLEAVRDYHFPDTRKMVPLTLEQLRGMDDKAVRVRVLESDCQGLHTGIVTMNDPNDSDNGVYAGCAFRCIKDYGKTWLAYDYPPAHIDWEVWMAEWRNHYRSGATAGTGYVCSSCDMWNGRKSHICPSCGKAMDADGLSELEKRLRG